MIGEKPRGVCAPQSPGFTFNYKKDPLSQMDQILFLKKFF